MSSVSVLLLLRLLMINALVTVQIHRNSTYNPQSSCAFLRNISLSNDASIQSCIWTCDNDRVCQTAVYYENEKICSIFAESCEKDHIQSSGSVQSSVICYRKNPDQMITCSSSATTPLEEKVELTTTEVLTSTQSLGDPVRLTNMNETVYGLWNTTAGGNSTLATNTNYDTGKAPERLFDGDCNTEYTNFGACNESINLLECGTNTGFYLTLERGLSLLLSFRFCTSTNDWRDPLTITVEGSNQPSSTLTLGSSWVLIYNGSTGLPNNAGRNSYGSMVYVPNNRIRYASYRLLITSKSSIGSAAQYSEVELYGY